jgi:Uma2 family endonuclease
MRRVKHLPRYTVSDYTLWEGAWELIDGIPYSMSPPAVRKHQVLAGQLFLQIGNSIAKLKEGCGNCRVVYELDWILDNTTVVRPDIAVICAQTGDFITAPPALIIEVLSPSTALKDRRVKFDIYEEQGVLYYVVIDPETKIYSVYVLREGSYAEQKNITPFTLHEKCVIELDIDKAFLELGEE